MTANEATDTFKAGDWVVVTEAGPWFGKTGEIARVPDSLRDRADWIVIVTAGGTGVGFFERHLMLDPRAK